jgi:hypothetical protein
MNAVLQVQDATESTAAERRALDLYATRPEVAKEIVERLAAEIRVPDIIIEPSAGPGRFVAAALAVWPRALVIAVDVDGAHRAACLAAGAAEFHECDWPTWVERHGRPGGRLLVLGNPPFSHATAHVDAALRLLEEHEHLVFLLRLALLGAEKRVEWWASSPLEEVPLIIPRPGFPKADGSNGSDNAEYGVYRWTKGYRGRPTIAPPILWGAAKTEAEAARQQLPLHLAGAAPTPTGTGAP